MNRVMNVLVPTFVLMAAVALATPAVGDLSYSETFSTTGVQATTTATALTNYPSWTYYEVDPGAAQCSVDTAGVLKLSSPNTDWSHELRVELPAAAVTGGAETFDLSTEPLTVSVKMGATGAAGYVCPALRVGGLQFQFFPGFSGLEQVLNNTAGTTLHSANDLKFTPDLGTQYTTSVTIVEQGRNYKVDYSISGLVGGVLKSFSNELTPSIESVGDIDMLALYDGYWRQGSGSGCRPLQRIHRDTDSRTRARWLC